MNMTRGRILALSAIVVVATFLRLYRLDELVVFLGDQGRDVTAVQAMLETGQPALVGPGSYFGGFRRGPAYYYLLLPALWVTGGEPLSAGALIALADVAAVALLFVLARALGGASAGWVAAGLYTSSWIPIQVARGFTNPSLLPLLTLGMLYALWRIVTDQDRYLILLVVLWLIAWQLHDQVWLLMPMFGLTLFLFRPRIGWRAVGWAAVGALLTLAPFLWYEASHGASNTHLMLEYVLGFLENPAKKNGITVAFTRLLETFSIVSAEFSRLECVQWVWRVALVVSVGALLKRVRTEKRALFLLLVGLIPVLYLVWPGPVYAVNVAIVLPIPFLLLGYGFSKIPPGLWQKMSAAALCLLCAWNVFVVEESIRFTLPTRGSYVTAREITQEILTRTAGSPFVFEMSMERPTEAYASPYLYLLKRAGATITDGADAMRVHVYDPATLAAEDGGATFQDIRVVTYAAPADVGLELLGNTWRFPKGGRMTAEHSIELPPSPSADTVSAIQRVTLEADTDYLVRFECRGALAGENGRVFVQLLNGAGEVLQTIPQNGAYECPPAVDWKYGSMLVQTTMGTERGAIFLQKYGQGAVSFRNVRLHKTVLKPLQ